MTTLVTDPGRNTPARLASSAILACQPDQRLVKLVRSGHERAFDAIVERYRGQLVRYCRRILPESRSEDAVQQTLINAHDALRASTEPVQLRAWLFAIARNSALNMLRQNGWNYEQIPLDFDGVQQPDQVYEQRLELEQTVAALRDLPARQREALVMRELEGRSYDEIALALGTGDGAVRQLLNRARVTLRAAASALIPSSLVERAASIASGDGGAIAQVIGGVGLAGVAKAGATALIAGSLVIGVANAPLPIGASREHARAEGSTRNVRAAGRSRATLGAQGRGAASVAAGSAGRTGFGDGSHGGAAPDDSDGRSGSDDSHGGSGSSGSGTSGRNGSDDVGITLQRSGELSGESGSSESGSSGSGSGSSGSGSGSSGSGSDGSGSGSRGSGSSSSGSSSGSSGPGPSGSGSDGSGSGASGSSSGSSGSGSSGSGSSGSGSSGSGSSGSGSSGSGSGSSSDGGSSPQPISTSTTSGSSGSGPGDPTSSGSGTSGSTGSGDATDH